MRAEIWLGGMQRAEYDIRNVKKVELNINGTFCKIITEDGYVFETAPQNVVIGYHQKEMEREG